MNGKCSRLMLSLLLMLAASTLWAQGPPFQTDDPVPVDLHHYEFYIFGSVDGTPAEIDSTGPAFEFNWGAIPRVQLHAILPTGGIFPSNNPVYQPGGMGPRANPLHECRGLRDRHCDPHDYRSAAIQKGIDEVMAKVRLSRGFLPFNSDSSLQVSQRATPNPIYAEQRALHLHVRSVQ